MREKKHVVLDHELEEEKESRRIRIRRLKWEKKVEGLGSGSRGGKESRSLKIRQ